MTASRPEPSPSSAARKQKLVDARHKGRELLDLGMSGREVTSWLFSETRAVVSEIIVDVCGAAGPSPGTAIAAIGGTGRGELFPYSDVDLLFLSARESEAFSEQAASVVRACWDCGIHLGHTVQSIAEADAMARDVNHFTTALVWTRAIAGDAGMITSFQAKVFRRVKRRLQDYIDECVSSREAERGHFGEAVKQLEPDVKRAPGGLRDVHLMQWIARAVADVNDLSGIESRRLVPPKDAAALQRACEFLSRIRADLHFHAGRAHEVLTRDDQLRIAESRGIESETGQRPVERFMQAYFRHSTAIAEISGQFVRRHRPRTLRSRLSPLIPKRTEGFVVREEGIDIMPWNRQRMCSDLNGILKLFFVSLTSDEDLAPELLELIRDRVPELPAELSPECAELFFEILRTSGDAGRVLRSMYATGVLEHLIPQFAHTRGLIQFNQYHSYTVDEHTLRAIEAVRDFESNDRRVGSAYRATQHKATLHLAILLHDIGKGHDRDHSELGAEIAGVVGPRLFVSKKKQGMIDFLVRHHLLMSHLALRRDISDTQLIVNFARDVGSPERLRMLYVLTAADITAVGPGVFNDWKAGLLGELYSRTMEVMSGKPERHLELERTQAACAEVAEAIRAQPTESVDDEWLELQLSALPPFYLIGESTQNIVRDLLGIRALQPDGLHVSGRYLDETDTVEFRVVAHGEPAVGCFHKIAGVLSAMRMDILSAAICTTRDQVVIDAFSVSDNDFRGEVPIDRIRSVSRAVEEVLSGNRSVEDLLARQSRYANGHEEEVSELKTRVVIDNDCSRDFTVVDVFAYDRPGLLYALSAAIYELGLSVQLARIGTHLDQVVDVFYVIDQAGNKILGAEQTAALRQRLGAAAAGNDS